MPKKLKLSEIKLKSFVTNEVKGGGPNPTNLGHDCSYQPHCYTLYGNACPTKACASEAWNCESVKFCISKLKYDCDTRTLPL